MELTNESDKLLAQNDRRCRVCLSASENNKSIFNSHMIFNHENDEFGGLLEKLQFYGGIEVAENDGFPAKICINCLHKLCMAHNFRMQCQETDNKLRKLPKQITNESSHDSSSLIGIEKSMCSEKEEQKKLGIKRNLYTSRKTIIIKKSSFGKLSRPWQTTATKTCLVGSPNKDEDSKKSESNVSGARNTKSLSKIEAMRCRKLVIFKKITSMENLKNRKEQQRRYIKNSNLSKQEIEQPHVLKSDDTNGTASAQQVPSDLTILPYQCTKCCRSYTTEKSLIEHKFTHQYKKYSCDRCNKPFNNHNELLKHMNSHESNEKLEPATCTICHKNFRKFLTMVRHLHVHKRENPRAVYLLLKDIRDKKKTKNGKVTMKNSYLENKIILDTHDNVTNSKCDDECLMENTRLESQIPSDNRSTIKIINSWIKEELDNDVQGKGFPCKNCDKSYVTKKSLLNHVSKMHNCKICIRNCGCPEKALKNGQSSEKSKPYACSECDKAFGKASRLERHSRIHARDREHQDKNFKRFLCHICSKTFRQNTGLMFHMRTHTGYKPHVCKYCGRGFTSNSNCTNHERTHTGDRPFVCHFCSAAFAKSCTLKAHITTHTGEANYHCKTCGKSFRRLKYLKEHRFTHTGEKPYACKICGTAYSHSGSLFVHEKKCKAQRGTYREIEKNYCDAVARSTLMTAPCNSILTHLADANISGNEEKIYIEGMRKIIGHTGHENVHIHSSNISDEPANPRSFTIIEQMFPTQ